MKTKTLILAGLICAASVASSVAQSVFSANAVGYVTLTIPPGFSMIANQLNGTGTTVPALLGSVPAGTQVFKFNTGTQSYSSATYLGNNAWAVQATANAMSLNPGEGIFIKNNTATSFSLTFVGSVPSGSLVTVLPAGFTIASSQVPQVGLLATDLGLPVSAGDSVYLYDNVSGYSTRFYLGGVNWVGGEPQVAVGQAFFVKKQAQASWNRNFSISN
jgi:hypothetical protein